MVFVAGGENVDSMFDDEREFPHLEKERDGSLDSEITSKEVNRGRILHSSS